MLGEIQEVTTFEYVFAFKEERWRMSRKMPAMSCPNGALPERVSPSDDYPTFCLHKGYIV